MLNKKVLTPEQALQKLRHYCAYQERCHQEVKEKLFNLGIRKSQHDEIVSTLIEENYLNEALRHLDDIAVLSKRKEPLKELASFLIKRQH